MVVADSHLNARIAAALVRADITSAKAILSIEDAMAAKSWFDGGPRVYARGDLDTALKDAPHRLTGAI